MTEPTDSLIEDVLKVSAEAEQLHSADDIDAALDHLADQINGSLAGQDLLVLCLMNGGLVTTGRLLPRLPHPLRLDYVHATRYRNRLQGDQLQWLAGPHSTLTDQTVLVVDDIFDEGHTLAAVCRDCRAKGAHAVYSAVLVDKQHNRKVPGFVPDFVGLQVADRYIFGSGMDYKGYLRNLPGIYALAD